MTKDSRKYQAYEELDHSFYNIEKYTKGLKNDEEMPRAGFLYELAQQGRDSVRNARSLSGMTPIDYAKKIEEMMDEESLMRMNVEGLRNERDQIAHILDKVA